MATLSQKKNATPEEVEKALKQIPQMGFAMETIENKGTSVKLKVVVPSGIGTFKVKGKIIGPKEIAEETKSKIEKHLKANFNSISVTFVD